MGNAGTPATTTSVNTVDAVAVPPPQPFPLSQANGGNNEVKDEVGGGGDGLSGMALTSAGPTSYVNGGNNEAKGKVGGGGDGLSRMALALAGPTSHVNGV